MRTLIVLNGPIADDQTCLAIAQSCDYRICADGGARHMVRLGVIPDLLIGDLDSITADDLAWMQEHKVPIEKHPVRKDWTDSELAIAAAVRQAENQEHEIWLIGALGARWDHVLANLGIGARLAHMGCRVWLTDGRVFMIPMAGRTTLRVDLDRLRLTEPLVSLVPAAGSALTGVTLTGLSYPLERATLAAGSTRGVSNYVLPGVRTVRLQIESGQGYVVILPAQTDGTRCLDQSN